MATGTRPITRRPARRSLDCTRSSRWGGWAYNQPRLVASTACVDPVTGAELLQHVFDVALNGQLAQMDVLGNFAIGQPVRDKAQDFALPLAQCLLAGVGVGRLTGDCQHLGQYLAIDNGLTPRECADPGGQVEPGDLLEHVAVGAGGARTGAPDRRR